MTSEKRYGKSASTGAKIKAGSFLSGRRGKGSERERNKRKKQGRRRDTKARRDLN